LYNAGEMKFEDSLVKCRLDEIWRCTCRMEGWRNL